MTAGSQPKTKMHTTKPPAAGSEESEGASVLEGRQRRRGRPPRSARRPCECLTVNVTSRTRAISILGEVPADVEVLCLQEIKIVQSDMKWFLDKSMSAGWKGVATACAVGGKGGASAGVALLCRKHLDVLIPDQWELEPARVVTVTLRTRGLGAVNIVGVYFECEGLASNQTRIQTIVHHVRAQAARP